MDSFFAVSAPGLEAFTAIELLRLGLLPAASPADQAALTLPETEPGGVTFEGTRKSLYRANLRLRTASRVLTRMEEFYAASFSELHKKASRLPWERYLAPGQPVAIRVTCHKSKLYHSDAVAERIARGIAEKLGKESLRQKPGDEETENPAQLIVARLVNDRCMVSVDSSGELLHRRGYRQAVARAPLRETLAAGMLMACGWDAVSPLLDPFCGSGTIPIEAALLALGLAPGRNRRFAFMNWPGFDAKIWQAILAESAPASKAATPIIQASDRDEGAVRMAQENAERAGVAGAIQFTCRAVSAIEPPARAGWVVTNPPYGLRVSEGKDLRNLYAQFGNVLRAKCPAWQAALLCNDPALLGQTKLKLDTSLSLINGGVNVRLARGKV
ncbi:MAG: class I SAM-dependent RNA methyltransferase [Anaerolineales bacterium]